MPKTKTISDKLAKMKCAEWLGKNGFSDIKSAKNESCDLVGKKNGKNFYIEIKYSSKEEGDFFGTVMLTEMFQAINNKKNYLFLVCRGTTDNINDWFFKLFKVQDFIMSCTLTTPIFLYHLYPSEHGDLIAPKFRKNTILASEKLIRKMWKDFAMWKSKPNLSKLKFKN